MNKCLKLLLSVLSAMLFVVSANAQITTSALHGRVLDQSGEVIPGATVVAVHNPSGTKYYAVANEDGLFFINGMRSGGPYSVEVSCLGYQTVSFTDVTLQLADAYSISATLKDDKQMLSEAIVISDAATKFSTEKTGAATNISNNQITQVPTISRSISDIAKLSPYGGNGMSFAGADGRTANFTVDGANFNNNFGLSDALPGGGNPISLDAIEEVQVVVSPFDVRQTNFIGGGINAITKSGTNTLKGTAYYYHKNENMRGDVAAGQHFDDARETDRQTTYGFTLGGPIVKDKLFFFVNYEQVNTPSIVNRWKASKDGQPNADAFISRTTEGDLQTVSDFLQKNYGYETGSFSSFPADESNTKILARIDWNINDKHHLAIRYNHTDNLSWKSPNGSSSDAKQRAVQNRMSMYGMSYANSMYSQSNIVNTWSLDLNSRLTDRLSNQFLATYSQLDDVRGSSSKPFPFIDILDAEDSTLPYISAGYELFTWNNAVHNRVVTIKDDVTYFTGNHKITAGASYEYQMADNAYMRNGTGYYRYKSLNDFLTESIPETVCLTYGYDGEANPAARVRFSKISVYGQDEVTVSDYFKLTYGARLETMVFNNKDIATNPQILEIDYNGKHIDTGVWPSTKIQVSPRVGFVWDVNGDKSFKVRGGTGLFTGRLPLVFFTNMPTNSGMVQNNVKIQEGNALLEEFSGKMITNIDEFIKKLNDLDAAKYPISKPENGVAPSSISSVDPDFKMPRVWKTSLAFDYQFNTSFPMSLTVEGIFNKTVNGVCIKDYNIKSTEGFARFNGADNRHIYPTDFTYTYNYAKGNTGTSAYVLSNTNRGYGWSASAQLNISPVRGLDITAAYTHTVSKELTGMPGSDASSAFTYIPTTEGPNNAVLHNSSYDEPDRAFINLTYNDESNNHISLFWEAWRGGYNYSYMYAKDLNGDSYNYDAIYIPKDASEIRFKSQDDADRYFAFAENDPYLSKHKGEYAEAYSVYSPWVNRLDLRYSHDFKIKVGNTTNTLQLSLDVKNVLNLFNDSWGVVKYMNPSLNSGRILDIDRIDPDGVPVFSTPKAVNGNTQTWTYNKAIGQCWYAQIGIKYMFN